MPKVSRSRLVLGQGGSALIELVTAMPIAILVLGIAIQALGVAGRSQTDIERRTEALNQAQIGLERMTREIRDASWAYFISSNTVELDALVRTTPTSTAVHRHVRYDCSSINCVRYEGPAVAYPPPATATWDTSQIVIGATSGDTRTRYGKLTGHDIFFPAHVDATTGQTVTDFASPTMLQVRLRLTVVGRPRPVELVDGVSLRNRSTFQ
jgi:Tfp pilus assembly protein PilW